MQVSQTKVYHSKLIGLQKEMEDLSERVQKIKVRSSFSFIIVVFPLNFILSWVEIRKEL